MKLLKITLVCTLLALSACGKKKKSDDKKDDPNAQTKTISGSVTAAFTVEFDLTNGGYQVTSPEDKGGAVPNPSAEKGKVAECTLPSPGATSDNFEITISEDNKKLLELSQDNPKFELKFTAENEITLSDDANKSDTEKLFDALAAAKFPDKNIPVGKDKKMTASLTIEKNDTNQLIFTHSAKCEETIAKEEE